MASPNGYNGHDEDETIHGLPQQMQNGLLLGDGGDAGYYDQDQPQQHLQTPSQPHSAYSSPARNVPITRTVAIIKNHALQHRFEIERRIQEASFEIVKERQMEFDTETDPETLEEIFGEDALVSLSEGPVWVYVLERRRAVEVWQTLMGPRDPSIAQHEAPNSLRALYGLSDTQNALMGSPDSQTAEIQIQALFASSPPFPASDLPPEDEEYQGVTAAGLEALNAHTDEGYAGGYGPSSVTNPSAAGSQSTKLTANGTPAFRARPVPVTTHKPDIVPRMTKAAALRAGIPVEQLGPSTSAPRKPIPKERQAETFKNVPGHKRSETISVASTAAPAIAPRMTRAASLRLGKAAGGAGPVVAPPVRRAATTDDAERKKVSANTFEGVPGHKRRETISVASVRPPTVAPRLNKSAALRAQKDSVAPPTAFKGPSRPSTISRSNSVGTVSPPTAAPPLRSRPSSQASGAISRPPPSSFSSTRAAGPRASSATGMRSRPSSVLGTSKANGVNGTSNTTTNTTSSAGGSDGSDKLALAAKPRPRPSSIGAPTIAPRTNKSAALRAAKKEAEAQAAAALAAKNAKRGVRPPPSSFKAVSAT
ncbi:hypothetical protein CC2G_012493 [Coprinopsis cinerea AmutBmut pab1-1]|nr:hypothetical protein CC2G_012493 [Coprinopsis cinerea AmutBmut pab1-1]